MEEELAQHFYNKLLQPKANPGLILAQFYATFYKLGLDQKLIGQFGKLVKLYGRNAVFLALLDVFDVDDVTHENIIRLVVYFVKDRLVSRFTHQENVDLSSSIEQTLKDLKKALKNPAEEQDNPFDA